MTQENKELLLKDLSTRLPYGVVVNYNGLARPLFCIAPTQHFQITLDNALDGEHNGLTYVSLDVDGKDPIPYLRPLSSMTEEEARELGVLHDIKNILSVKVTTVYIDYIIDDGVCSTTTMTLWCDELISSVKCFDWLNSKHFDYRGLILKGLAITVTDENNPYK